MEINEEENGQEPQESTSKEKPLEMTNLPTSELPVTPVVSCSSPYKFENLFCSKIRVTKWVKPKRRVSSKPPSVFSSHRMELETQLIEEHIAAKMMRKREEMELRQLQREMELLAKREALELAATQREVELELIMKKLQLESTRGSCRDSLSSISSSLRAKTKTDNWLNSENNVFDSFAAHDNHSSNCPDVTSNFLAPT